MTDKEKKELKDGVISIFKKFNILDHTATTGSLRDDVLKYIDSMQEEPVSDEVKIAAQNNSDRYAVEDILEKPYHHVDDAFEEGAKWQRQKDEHLIWEISSNNYEKGKQEGKEQIMENAADVTVHIDAGGYPYIPQIELYDYDKDVPLAKEGDKYKVVLIKEE